jgi:hypothetical protein
MVCVIVQTTTDLLLCHSRAAFLPKPDQPVLVLDIETLAESREPVCPLLLMKAVCALRAHQARSQFGQKHFWRLALARLKTPTRFVVAQHRPETMSAVV